MLTKPPRIGHLIYNVIDMDCDVVLIPPERVSEQAIKASRELSRLGSSFVLDGSAFYPHLSLYILRLDIGCVEQAAAALTQIAGETQAFQLEAAGYISSHKYVVANYKKTDELTLLQNKLVEALNRFRDGMPESERENMQGATEPAVLKNFEQYGYKYIGSFFTPHITLTRFTEEHPLDELALPEQKVFDGRYASIGLFQLGPHSTCVRKLADFPLGG